jgi:hypothetical protein
VRQDKLAVASNRVRSGPAHLFVEWGNGTGELLWLRRADTVGGHLNNLVVCARNTDVAILNGLNRLTEPVSIDLLRAHAAKISNGTYEKQGDCGYNHHAEVLHDCN